MFVAFASFPPSTLISLQVQVVKGQELHVTFHIETIDQVDASLDNEAHKQLIEEHLDVAKCTNALFDGYTTYLSTTPTPSAVTEHIAQIQQSRSIHATANTTETMGQPHKVKGGDPNAMDTNDDPKQDVEEDLRKARLEEQALKERIQELEKKQHMRTIQNLNRTFIAGLNADPRNDTTSNELRALHGTMLMEVANLGELVAYIGFDQMEELLATLMEGGAVAAREHFKTVFGKEVEEFLDGTRLNLSYGKCNTDAQVTALARIIATNVKIKGFKGALR